MNQRGTHLLFRDKKRHLHLFSLSGQERTTLLNYCQYVQWVPGSDVIVAQSRNNLCVWYSVNKPDNVTMFPIKGEVVDIERHNHRTGELLATGRPAATQLSPPLARDATWAHVPFTA